MCMVSNVSEYGQQDWRDWQKQWPTTIPYTGTGTGVVDFTHEYAELIRLKEAYRALIAAAEKFDHDTKQPECADEKKLAWMDEVETRLSDLQDFIVANRYPRRDKSDDQSQP